jgi:hypothetical protein
LRIHKWSNNKHAGQATDLLEKAIAEMKKKKKAKDGF